MTEELVCIYSNPKAVPAAAYDEKLEMYLWDNA